MNVFVLVDWRAVDLCIGRRRLLADVFEGNFVGGVDGWLRKRRTRKWWLWMDGGWRSGRCAKEGGYRLYGDVEVDGKSEVD